MQAPQRLRLVPRPSRIGCASVSAACAISAVLLAAVPLPLALLLPSAAIILVVLAKGLWHCTGRGVPALLHVGIDRRITVTAFDARSRGGTILDDSFVGAWLTTIVWQPDGMPWWHPAPAIVVFPDMLAPEEFRRLRVALRYGRLAAAAAASGDDAA
jgi:hypothetical protein